MCLTALEMQKEPTLKDHRFHIFIAQSNSNQNTHLFKLPKGTYLTSSEDFPPPRHRHRRSPPRFAKVLGTLKALEAAGGVAPAGFGFFCLVSWSKDER